MQGKMSGGPGSVRWDDPRRAERKLGREGKRMGDGMDRSAASVEEDEEESEGTGAGGGSAAGESLPFSTVRD